MEWTEEIIAQLKALWAEGLSTAEIGRRLSITKNAVVGKAHRLGLPPRPSPIRRNAKPKTTEKTEAASTPATAQTAIPSQPAKQAEATPAVAAEKPQAPTSARVTTPVAPAAPTAEEKPVKKEKPAASSKSKPKASLRSISDPEPQKRRGPSCCWPIGDPGTPGFHFCGATPIPGKPYCEEHAQIAYVRLRDRRDNVA
ncbi:GcrA cell cycle regulator [Acetobacter pomorum]|uniref:GcrA cell cycle regulator n=1 Tax=Acetobacter pomorum TaxID=65959 RepID=A0A2G4R8N7_9PROT|nr:GcrA family cell cycle regulator [Acetobacter pomorum]PHY92951.1 GcrA cell cycle regulator [Acetobacter pomorum]